MEQDLQDLNESRIETLDVYEFDCDGKSSLEEAVLRTVYTANTGGYEWSDAQVGGSNGSRLVLNLDLDDMGERIFLFVANAGCATNSGTAEDLTQLTSESNSVEADVDEWLLPSWLHKTGMTIVTGSIKQKKLVRRGIVWHSKMNSIYLFRIRETK